jgi:hypothetical protein
VKKKPATPKLKMMAGMIACGLLEAPALADCLNLKPVKNVMLNASGSKENLRILEIFPFHHRIFPCFLSLC